MSQDINILNHIAINRNVEINKNSINSLNCCFYLKFIFIQKLFELLQWGQI
jgi:hypothetical protein